MESAVFTFPTDFAGETTAGVLGRIHDEAGVGGVIIAANYHTARDIFPHNLVYKVHAIRGGALFIEGATAQNTSIGGACVRDPLAAGEWAFPHLVSAAHAEGVKADAWLNYCHLDNWAVPAQTLCRNAYGDLDYSTVCPSSNEVSEFAVALTKDAASTGVDGIVAEATTFNPLEHGYHHERWLGALSELARFLLGLCFCDSCRKGIAAEGADVVRLTATVRECVDKELKLMELDELRSTRSSGPAMGATQDDAGTVVERLYTALGDDVEPLLSHRERAVSALREQIVHTAHEAGVRMCFVDPSGALKGYLTGKAVGPAGPLPSWVVGSDPVTLAGRADSVGILAYTTSAERVHEELAQYRLVTGDLASSSVVLRPAAPDCQSAQDLVEKVAFCREAGVGRVAFYHYGLFPLRSLGWVRQALWVATEC
jgi:hypothetical protein